MSDNASGNGHDTVGRGGGLSYPCRYDIKVMGRTSERFAALAQLIVMRHTPEADLHAVHDRLSRDDNYISLTFTVTARSAAQIEAIYQDLAGCPEVLFAL